MSDAPLPHRLQGHYCRECGEAFPAVTPEGVAPHAQVWHHILRFHRTEVTSYHSCSRYCDQRAQYEEQDAGRRLYGKGVAKPPPQTQTALKQMYDRLFPPD